MKICSYCQETIPDNATKCPSCGGWFKSDIEAAAPLIVKPKKKDLKPVRPYRTFAQLHQDVWRCALKHPFYFFLLPAILYFPFDLLAEFLSFKMQKGFVQELKIYYRIGQLADFLAGTYLFGVHLEILRLMAEGQPVENSVLKKGFTYFGKILGASLTAGVRSGLYFLLLIVPGIIKVIQFALLGPLIVLGGWGARTAVSRSEIMMKGHVGRFLRYAFGAMLVYIGGWFGMSAFFPESTSPVVNALYSLPFNAILSLWTIGLCLFYVDLAPEKKGVYRRPVRAIDPVAFDYDAVTDRPSRKSVGLAVALSMVFIVSGIIYMSTRPYFDGELYVFAAQEHQLYYDPSFDPEEVHAIARACQMVEMFQGDWSMLMLLEPYQGHFRLNVVEGKDYWNEPDLLAGMKELEAVLSTQHFSQPVDLVLYDDENDKRLAIAHEIAIAEEDPVLPVVPDPLAQPGEGKEWY